MNDLSNDFIREMALIRGENPKEKHTIPRAERKPLNIRVDYRKRGYQRGRADLMDLSYSGFQIDVGLQFHEGDMLWIHLPGMQAMSGLVVWQKGNRVGCQFEHPIRDYIFDQLVKDMASRR